MLHAVALLGIAPLALFVRPCQRSLARRVYQSSATGQVHVCNSDDHSLKCPCSSHHSPTTVRPTGGGGSINTASLIWPCWRMASRSSRSISHTEQTAPVSSWNDGSGSTPVPGAPRYCTSSAGVLIGSI